MSDDSDGRPVPEVGAPLVAGAQPTDDRYRWMVETVGEVIFEADPAGNWTYLNPAWTRTLGYPTEDCIGKPFLDYVHPEDRQANLDVFVATVAGGKNRCRFEARYLTADGSIRHMEIHAWIFRGPSGEPLGSTGTLTDVTERRAAEAELEHRANHDALTGLPSRTVLSATIAAALTHSRECPTTELALLFLDLDRFKLINDSLGHDAGDEVLRVVATRLRDLCREGDLVARFGGDEFVLLCPGMSATAATLFADLVRSVLGEPIPVGDRQLCLTASVGIRSMTLATDAVGIAHPDAHGAAQSLLRDADAAMYAAKDAGRDRSEPFDDRVRARVVRRLDTETALRRAIARDELVLHYQPQFALDGGTLIGYEALVRWHQADGTLMMPTDFIPIAEETGLIGRIGRWVLFEACRQLAAAEARHAPIPRIAVNISAREIATSLVRDVRQALDATGAPPERLCLELTESALLTDTELVLASMNNLVGMGVSISLDDFGTGFSSLSYLQRLPLSELKIDRSFVTQVGRADGYAIIAAIVQLAQALDLATVAEGVEEQAELRLLEEIGCGAAQGFLLGRPDDITELVRVCDRDYSELVPAVAASR